MSSGLGAEGSGQEPIAYDPLNQIHQKSADTEHLEPDLDFSILP